MIKTINLKGTIGDNITVVVDDENTNYCTIKFDDSLNGGLKSSDQIPTLVETMGWYYASTEDLANTESLYNIEISKKKLWSDAENT
jgi:hypothetical protein